MRRLLLGFAQVAVVGGGALGIVTRLYRSWDRPFSIPYENVYDARQVSAFVKSIINHGWLITPNPNLGAPFSKYNVDHPTAGETLQRVAIWVLSAFSDRFGVVMNAYYLLGFAAVAIAAFLVLKSLQFRFLIAGPIALLYAFLPFHFAHGESHLVRSMYLSAPIGALVILWVLTFRTTLLKEPEGRLRPWSSLRANVRWNRVAVLVTLCGVVAITESLTMVFVLVTLVIGCLIAAIRDRSPSVLLAGALASLAVVAIFLIALIPNLAYWSEHGRNERAAKRNVVEQEVYGLKISQLLLPIPVHRSQEFREVRFDAIRLTRIPSESGQALGIIGGLGFVGALVGVLARGIPRRSTKSISDRVDLWRYSGYATLILVLFATISGFALLISLSGFQFVRVWGRSVVVIGFFSLLTVAIALEAVIRWIEARGPTILRRGAPIVLMVGVLGFGLWDTAVPYRFDQPREANTHGVVRDLVHEIEREIPKDAAVFQLPVVPYPEYRSRFGRVFDYELMLPYLWSDSLRWSYGGTKGRPEADWQRKVDSDAPAQSLAALRGLGFQGILVDRWAYESDDGAKAIADLTAALGPPVLATPDEERWQFWSLRDYARRAGLDRRELREAAVDLVGRRLYREAKAGS